MSRYDRERDRARMLRFGVAVLIIGALFFAFGRLSQRTMDTASHDMVEER